MLLLKYSKKAWNLQFGFSIPPGISAFKPPPPSPEGFKPAFGDLKDHCYPQI